MKFHVDTHYIHSFCVGMLGIPHSLCDEVLIALTSTLYNVLQGEILQLKSVIHQEHGTAQPGVYYSYLYTVCV